MRPAQLAVAWVLYDSLEIVSGGTIYDKQIVEVLRALGHAVEVVALLRSDRPSEVREKAIHALSRLANVSGAAPLFVCDELCFPHLPHLPRGLRRVLLVHHLSLWEREAPPALARIREIACVRSFSVCIATGPRTCTRLREEFGIDAVLVPPGADRLLKHWRGDNSRSGPAPESTRPPRLLFVGSVTPRKRALELLETLAQAPAPVHLTLVGSLERDRDYVAKVKACAEHLAREAPGFVSTFAGELTDEGLARAYETHDALIVSSSLEGYGMVVDEALSFGLPVIIERDAIATDTLVEGVNARVFSFADPSPLFGYIEHSEEQMRLAITCRRSSANLPTWQSSVARFEGVLHDD